MSIPKYKPPHSGERALDKSLSTLLVYFEEAVLLDNRSKPCAHCDSTGKAADTFDKLCPECTPIHCVRCGSTKRLTECRATYLSTYQLCPVCLADERQQS